MPARSDGVRGALCRAHRWLAGTAPEPEPGPQVLLRLAGLRLAVAALDGGTAPVPAAGPAGLKPGPPAESDPDPPAGSDPGPQADPGPRHPDPIALLCADPTALRAAADAVAGDSAFGAAQAVEMAQHDVLAVAVAAAVLAVRATDLRVLAGVLRAAVFSVSTRTVSMPAPLTLRGVDWTGRWPNWWPNWWPSNNPTGGTAPGPTTGSRSPSTAFGPSASYWLPDSPGAAGRRIRRTNRPRRCDAVGVNPYPADLVAPRSGAQGQPSS